ncbi:MAG: hypothetical protein MZV70_68035 [Desulfobacterales bacterium]|nr:hypothetical protein [Desulfobacterales bacterium]
MAIYWSPWLPAPVLLPAADPGRLRRRRRSGPASRPCSRPASRSTRPSSP